MTIAILVAGWLATVAADHGVAQPPAGTTSPVSADESDLARYRVCKARARDWLDTLEVDCVALTAHGIKGKKKLAEILDAYAFLHEAAAGDAPEQARILVRVGELAAQTRLPEYHNLREAPQKELVENSMSYLRVLRLLEDLGQETSKYRREVNLALPRLDAHMSLRGPWQRSMFRAYYQHFGLPLPETLEGAVETASVLDRRPKPGSISRNDAYRLTHQVFVACDYGRRREPEGLSAEELGYLAGVLPFVATQCMQVGDTDLLAEAVSSMKYLGWCDEGTCRRAVEVLLASQNDDGTWGDYEQFRPQYGIYLDQHAYLHTTLVCLSALGHVFETPWAGESAP